MKKISVYLMSFFYVMAGFNHFMNPEFYVKMMPPFLPAHDVLIFLSGGIEMLLGMMLIRAEVRSLAAWGVILLLIAVFPANIYMYSQGGEFFGVPDWALLVRLPLQLVLIAWAYVHTKNPEIDCRAIETSVEIAASPIAVWRELTDFSNYAEWNPFIIRLEGRGQVGDRMGVTLRLPDGGEFRFSNKIVVNEKPLELAWQGSFLFKGLFDGTHYFRIEELAGGRCRFVHGEAFDGVLVGILSKTLASTKRGFVAMNDALKARCE